MSSTILGPVIGTKAVESMHNSVSRPREYSKKCRSVDSSSLNGYETNVAIVEMTEFIEVDDLPMQGTISNLIFSLYLDSITLLFVHL